MVGCRDAKDWARTELDRPLIGDSLYTPFRGRDGEELDLDAYRALVRHCVGALGDHPDSRPPQQAVTEAVAKSIREIYESSALADDLVPIT